MLSIKLKKIEINGAMYYAIPVKPEKVGRKFVRDYLGISYMTTYRSPWYFPDFGEALKEDLTPYDKEELIKWLQIPSKKRRKLYEEYLNETHKQNRNTNPVNDAG